MVNVADLISTVARRERLLAALHESPLAKCDLVRLLDVSRSTVDRAVRSLESEKLVERRDEGYGLTLVGRLVYEEYRGFAERTAGLLCAAPGLDMLPVDTAFDPASLVGADLTLAERATPYRPGDRHLELIDDAERVRLLSTAISPRYVEVVREAVVERETTVHLGVTTPVAERLVEDHATALCEVLETGGVELRELDDGPPFSLGLFYGPEQTVFGALVYDGGTPRAYVENDTHEAAAYGEECFERYWASAEPITPVAARSSG